MTFDDFVVKAREARGDRFEYREDGWRGINGKVLVRCPEHGEWATNARWHLKGIECPRCSRPGTNLTFIEFVAQARERHGDKYEYLNEEWIGTAGSTTYVCRHHGRIRQKVFDHLKKGGCRHCSAVENGLGRRQSLQTFIEKARAIHGDAYDYLDGMVYGIREKMVITCRVHGKFHQTRQDHLLGHGCHACAGRRRRSTEDFITEARAIHGDMYGYEKSIFSGLHMPITITCHVHGDYRSHAKLHLDGKGCGLCSPTRRRTRDEFVADAVSVHGDRYDYSLVEYVNGVTPVTIICSEHGEFDQKPQYHLSNAIGCRLCTSSSSRVENMWLDSLGIDPGLRQARIILEGRSRSVDAYDPINRRVYEFWGSWWHGDPSVYDPRDIHATADLSFGELFNRTMRKRALIFAAGYDLVEIWESEFAGVQPSGKVKSVGRSRSGPPLLNQSTVT